VSAVVAGSVGSGHMPQRAPTINHDDPAIDDEAIRKLLTRLSRRHQSGGTVIERAAILAEGADSRAIVEWILARDGQAESGAPAVARGGLHGARVHGGATDNATPRRYVLPPGVLPSAQR